MATKKNLPNIPLYIGDWEKDCNILTLKTEAAWLRIIFKMFTNGKQSTYKVPTKGLQNLWRVPESEVIEIIEELTDYNICEITIDGRFVEFVSRRFQKENEVSEVRKDAVSNRKDRKKTKQNIYKTSTKEVQNTEIDIENESVIENENKSAGESKKTAVAKIQKLEIFYPFESELFRVQWELWKTYKKKQFKFEYKSEISEQAALKALGELTNDEKTAIAIIHQSIGQGWKGLFKLQNNENGNQARNNSNQSVDDIVNSIYGAE